MTIQTADNDPTVEPWRKEALVRLAAGETLEAGLELDLDEGLRYRGGLLAVTDRRLLGRSPGESEWREWTYRPGLRLVHHDHAGVGSLELHDETARLGGWRFTIGHNPAALRLVDAFERQLESHLSGRPVERAEEDVCPKCGGLPSFVLDHPAQTYGLRETVTRIENVNVANADANHAEKLLAF